MHRYPVLDLCMLSVDLVSGECACMFIYVLVCLLVCWFVCLLPLFHLAIPRISADTNSSFIYQMHFQFATHGHQTLRHAHLIYDSWNQCNWKPTEIVSAVDHNNTYGPDHFTQSIGGAHKSPPSTPSTWLNETVTSLHLMNERGINVCVCVFVRRSMLIIWIWTFIIARDLKCSKTVIDTCPIKMDRSARRAHSLTIFSWAGSCCCCGYFSI